MAWVKKYLLILFLMIIACIPQIIINNTLPVIFLNDSVWYLDFTRYFAAGGYFPDYYSYLKPVQCMINYPLGYPLFLDLCKLCSSTLAWGGSIVVCQHLLSLCSVLLIFLIGERIGRRIEGFCAAIAYALYLPRLIYAQAVMAETLFVFLSLLSLYIFFGILLRIKNKQAGILLGLVTALSILTKPLAVFGGVIFIVYFLVSSVDKKILRGFILTFAVVVLANLLYNWHFYGEFVLTTTSGSHLADRVIGNDRLFDKTNLETREIISTCVQSGLPFHFPSEWWNYLRALRSGGLSPQEADHLMMKAAIAGILSNPFEYIKNTWFVFKKNILEEDHWIDRKWILSKGEYVKYLKEWSTYPGGHWTQAEYDARRKILRNIAIDYPQSYLHYLGVGWIDLFDSKILKWRGFMGWVFMFSCLYGLFSKDRFLFFISLFTAINFLLIALTEAPFPRYFESFAPLVMLSVILSISTFWKRNMLGKDKR